MAIHHVVRCDGEICSAEKPLTANSGMHFQTMTTTGVPSPMQIPMSYSVPSDWLSIDGRNFCSYRCLADFADAKAKGQPR